MKKTNSTSHRPIRILAFAASTVRDGRWLGRSQWKERMDGFAPWKTVLRMCSASLASLVGYDPRMAPPLSVPIYQSHQVTAIQLPSTKDRAEPNPKAPEGAPDLSLRQSTPTQRQRRQCRHQLELAWTVGRLSAHGSHGATYRAPSL